MFSLKEPYTYNGYTFTPRLDDKSGNMKLYIKYPDSKLEFNKAFVIDEDRNFIRETASHGKLVDITYPYPHPLYKRMLDLMDGAGEEVVPYIIQAINSRTIIPAQPAPQFNEKGKMIYQHRFLPDDQVVDFMLRTSVHAAKVIAEDSSEDIVLRIGDQNIEIKHNTKLIDTDIILLHGLKTEAQRITTDIPPSRQTPDERLLVFITTLEEALDGSDPRTVVHALDQIHRLTLQSAVLTDVYTDLIPDLIVNSGYRAYPPASEELTPLLEYDTPEPPAPKWEFPVQRLIQRCLRNAETGGPGQLAFPKDFERSMEYVRESIAAEGRFTGGVGTSRISFRGKN